MRLVQRSFPAGYRNTSYRLNLVSLIVTTVPSSGTAKQDTSLIAGPLVPQNGPGFRQTLAHKHSFFHPLVPQCSQVSKVLHLLHVSSITSVPSPRSDMVVKSHGNGKIISLSQSTRWRHAPFREHFTGDSLSAPTNGTHAQCHTGSCKQ